MQLDIFTLFLLFATLSFLLGCGLIYVWLSVRSETGLLLWAISFLVRIPAFPLLILRGEIHDRLSIDLANTFLLLALGIGWVATRVIAQRSFRVLIALVPVAIWLASCQVPEIYAETGYRVFVYSMLTAVYSFAICFEFWRDAGKGHWLQKGLAGVFLVNALVHVFRGLYSVSLDLPHNLLQSDNLMGVSIFVPLILIILGTLITVAMYREQYLHSLKHDAEHDPLTNVLNRRAFLARAERILQERQREGSSIALLMCDLDHFKAINDSYGHLVGDQVLKQFASEIGGTIRRTDLFGRIGGEEFAVLVKGVSVGDALAVAEKIRKAVTAFAVQVGDRELGVSVSIGVGMRDEKSDVRDFDDLMKRADEALYEAKLAGRNRVRCYQAEEFGSATEEIGPMPVVEMVSVVGR